MNTDFRLSPMNLTQDKTLFLRCYRAAWICAHGSLLGFDEQAVLMGAASRAYTSSRALQKLVVHGQFAGILALDEKRETKKGLLWISFLFIEEKYRKQGWGRILIEAAADRGRELGRKELQLCVSRTNSALGFYDKLGFTVCGTEPGAAEELLKLHKII